MLNHSLHTCINHSNTHKIIILSASIAVNPIKISNFTSANLPTFYVHFWLAPNTYSCQIFQKLLLVLFQNTTHISQEFIIRQSPLKNIFYNFFYIPLLNFIPANWNGLFLQYLPIAFAVCNFFCKVLINNWCKRIRINHFKLLCEIFTLDGCFLRHER